VHGIETLLETYSQETVPPVPAVAEKELTCVTNAAETEVAEDIVTAVGELDVVEQAPDVQAHDFSM
jgi:hypothetical protein